MIIVWAFVSPGSPDPSPPALFISLPGSTCRAGIPPPMWERGSVPAISPASRRHVEPASCRQFRRQDAAATTPQYRPVAPASSYGPFRLARPLPPAPSPKGEGVTSISKSKSGSKSNFVGLGVSTMIIVWAIRLTRLINPSPPALFISLPGSTCRPPLGARQRPPPQRHNTGRSGIIYGPFRLARPLPPAPSPKGEGVTSKSISKSKSGSGSGSKSNFVCFGVSAMIILWAIRLTRPLPPALFISLPGSTCRPPLGARHVEPASRRHVEPASCRQFRRQDAAATTPQYRPVARQTPPPAPSPKGEGVTSITRSAGSPGYQTSIL